MNGIEKNTRMQHIRGKNTKPEMIVRRFLHSNGYRYRLHQNTLPGHPDIVLSKYKIAIFVNGCYWHGHEGCKYAVVPKTNTDFWVSKIDHNRLRDSEILQILKSMGWNTITIWECQLRPSIRESSLRSLELTINHIFLLNQQNRKTI